VRRYLCAPEVPPRVGVAGRENLEDREIELPPNSGPPADDGARKSVGVYARKVSEIPARRSSA